MPSLKAEEHAAVQRLCLEYLSGDEHSAKHVSIRDDLADIFAPYILNWRLHPDQVGIHPQNRDGTEEMTADACVLRGKKIVASGFSFAAIGDLWSFEENPVTQAITKHTHSVLASDKGFAPPCEVIKVGPGNWTHSNQFVRMVQHCATCSDRHPLQGW